MRFIVYGAGAVGGVVGARLHQHGHEVVLIARGRAPRRDHGGTACGSNRPTKTSPCRSRSSATRPSIEFRAGRRRAARREVAGHGGRGDVRSPRPRARRLPVVSLQNGVANEPTLLRWFAHVYGVCVMAPTAHVEAGSRPGEQRADQRAARHRSLPQRRRRDGHRRSPTRSRSARFESVARPDIMRWKYTKLLMNLGNAVDATCAPSEAAGDARASGARRRRRGASTQPASTHTSQDEDRERRGRPAHDPTDRQARLAAAGRRGRASPAAPARSRPTTSTARSCALGREHGVATPVNERVCDVRATRWPAAAPNRDRRTHDVGARPRAGPAR